MYKYLIFGFPYVWYNHRATASYNHKQYYENIRSKLIQLFAERGRADVAITLAEKYKDFFALARLAQDEDLERYMDRYTVENFPVFVFQMYLESGNLPC